MTTLHIFITYKYDTHVKLTFICSSISLQLHATQAVVLKALGTRMLQHGLVRSPLNLYCTCLNAVLNSVCPSSFVLELKHCRLSWVSYIVYEFAPLRVLHGVSVDPDVFCCHVHETTSLNSVLQTALVQVYLKQGDDKSFV